MSGQHAKVHPTAVIEGDVQLGEGVEVGALCYLRGPLIVGPGTRIWPHVIIGTEGEHKDAKSVGTIRIGARVTLRELVVIQRGTGDRDTEIGDDCFILDHAHVAHDCVVAEGVTLSPNVVLGGHTRVHRGATIGIGAMTHQRSTVGAFSMVGMGSVVTRDVPPFVVVAGNPARYMRMNAKGIGEAGLSPGAVAVWDGFLLHTTEANSHIASFHADSRRSSMLLHPSATGDGESALSEQHGRGAVLGRGE